MNDDSRSLEDYGASILFNLKFYFMTVLNCMFSVPSYATFPFFSDYFRIFRI
jgi:hypothetical protein